MRMQESEVQRGARSRVEAFYRRDGTRLWRSLVLYTGNSDLASDALAEALARALREGESIADAGAWIWRVAFRIAARESRTRRSWESLNQEVPYEMGESMVDLLRGLSKLSVRQRACVLLHHYSGYSLKEIAEILGSSAGAVAVNLHRGRARLRSLLEERS